MKPAASGTTPVTPASLTRLERRLFRPLTAFAFLWAAATIFHQAKWDHWASSPPDLVLSALAFAVLFLPWSITLLTLLFAAQLWTAADQSPWIGNHWTFVAFVALAWFLALPGAWRRRERGVDDDPAARLFSSFAPIARIELLVLYFWSFFHKLNSSWLDPAVSCGSFLYERLVGGAGFLPVGEGPGVAAIWGTLGIELAIPLLLVPRRTRPTGLALAALFHLVLGIGLYFNFSAVVYALLFLFMPEDLPRRLGQSWRQSGLRRRLRTGDARRRLRFAYLTCSGVLFAAAVAILFSQADWAGRAPNLRFDISFADPRRSSISRAFEGIWWVYGMALPLLAAAALRVTGGGQWAASRRLLAPVGALPLLAAALMFLNGASPYLGLKSETSFSMFSNLRTEAGLSNHLLVRGGRTRIAGFQDDLVAVRSSSDAELQRLADLGLQLPWFEFRSYLSRRVAHGARTLGVRYVRGGRSYEIESVAEHPELVRPDGFLARKLLRFRPVAPGRVVSCTH